MCCLAVVFILVLIQIGTETYSVAQAADVDQWCYSCTSTDFNDYVIKPEAFGLQKMPEQFFSDGCLNVSSSITRKQCPNSQCYELYMEYKIREYDAIKRVAVRGCLSDLADPDFYLRDGCESGPLEMSTTNGMVQQRVCRGSGCNSNTGLMDTCSKRKDLTCSSCLNIRPEKNLTCDAPNTCRGAYCVDNIFRHYGNFARVKGCTAFNPFGNGSLCRTTQPGRYYESTYCWSDHSTAGSNGIFVNSVVAISSVLVGTLHRFLV